MKLYLGAGKDRKEGWTTLDIVPFEGIDIVADAEKGIPLEDNSVDHVFTQDFMEHLHPEKKVFVINEIWRILKNGGTMEHYIPNAGSRNDFGSPSHLSHWNLQQFEHFDINSYRYGLDHDYEGFIGKFEKVLAEEVSPLTEQLVQVRKDDLDIEIPIIKMQSIHVIYRAIK